MGRTKVRHYPSREEYEATLKEYLTENKERYKRLILNTLGYEDFDSLWNDEYKGKFGLDCGWVQLHPKNKDMRHEWFLDNDRMPDYIFDVATVVYNTQSTIIKSIVIQQLVEDLGLENEFSIVRQLD